MLNSILISFSFYKMGLLVTIATPIVLYAKYFVSFIVSICLFISLYYCFTTTLKALTAFFVIWVINIFINFLRRTIRIKSIDKLGYIIITGCDSGFGKLLAKRLDSKGVRVIATCLTDNGVEQLESECSDKLKAIQLDITDEEQVKDFVEFVSLQVLGKTEKLYALVNNAGITDNNIRPEFFYLEPDDFRKVFEVNTIAMANLTLRLLPFLERGKPRGRVINMSSVNGRLIDPCFTSIPYTLSKVATEALSDCLRISFLLDNRNVSLHIIEPFFFKTDIINAENIWAKQERGFQRIPQSNIDKMSEDYKNRILNKDTVGKILNILDYISESNLDIVTDVYEEALFSKFPKRRYPININFSIFLSMLPSCITDYFLALRYICTTEFAIDPANKIDSIFENSEEKKSN